MSNYIIHNISYSTFLLEAVLGVVTSSASGPVRQLVAKVHSSYVRCLRVIVYTL
jgi:hypothetical protein